MRNKTLSRTDQKKVKKELKKASSILKSAKTVKSPQNRKKYVLYGVLLAAIVIFLFVLEQIFAINKEVADIMLVISQVILWLLMIGAVVGIGYIYNLFTGKISGFFHRYKKTILLSFTAVSLITITYLCLNPKVLFFTAPSSVEQFIEILKLRINPSELFGLYTAQLSLTFISISVMSVLSDKSVIIYWSNVSEDRLIEPTFTCFAAYTYYSIAATIGAGLGVIFEDSLLFVVFFILNVLSLILLTLTVTDVYYGRDTKKKKLAAKLRKIHDNAKSGGYHLEKYNRTMLSFSKNIYIAAQNGDLPYLQEAYDLVAVQPNSFENPTRHYKEGKLEITSGRDVIEALISTLDESTFSIFSQAMEHSLEVQKAAINRYMVELEEGAEVFAFDTLEPDSQFWEALSENEYFLNCLSIEPKTDREFVKQKRLINWIAARMELDYKQNAVFYRSTHPNEKLPLENPDWETTEKVMEYAFAETNVQDDRLFVSFAKLLCAAFEKESMVEHYISLFDNPPYLYYILDQIEFFEVQDNLRKKMNDIFRNHHPDEALRNNPKWASKQ